MKNNLRGNTTLEFLKNPIFFWLKQCFEITKHIWMYKCMVQASLIECKQKFKDLNVCETLNAFFSEPLFSILADTLLQNGCMNHFEFLTVAPQLHFIWNSIRNFRFDLNFLFYKQFINDFLVKNRILSFKSAPFLQYLI